MRVLVINCGSSTLKFEVIDVSGPDGATRRLAHGIVDRIGGEAALDAAVEERPNGAARQPHPVQASDHGAAARVTLEWLTERRLLAAIDAVGHRVVHGGHRFTQPVVIDDDVIAEIEALVELAPLHNGPALAAIRATRAALDATPMVAAFDTSFHATLPDRASRYAIPWDLAERHGIRRYGFHGLAHRWMAERCAALTGRPLSRLRLITLQLGNGCSAAAVDRGRSVDTTMGFTPLEGLMMGTRSGDIDPALVPYLARREGVSADQVEQWLNTKSGLLGVSGRSRDMRDLLSAASQGDERAAAAVDIFCYRVKKIIGAYMAVLGGADAVAFGGGIGEHAAPVRERACTGMEWCGIALDGLRNQAASGTESRISPDGSRVGVYVIPVDEAVVIARDTMKVMAARVAR